jgi:hypothetical protein
MQRKVLCENKYAVMPSGFKKKVGNGAKVLCVRVFRQKKRVEKFSRNQKKNIPLTFIE